MTAVAKSDGLGAMLRQRYALAVEQFEAQIAEATALRHASQAAGDAADAGTTVAETEEASIVTSALHQQVMRLERALARYENGTFGDCDRCGKPIAPARLKIVPWAIHCVSCQEHLDRH